MAKQVLNMSAAEDDHFADSAMIGMATPVPAYHLCWALNRRFDLELARDMQHNILMRKKDRQYCFPVYAYELPNSMHRYLLYKLKDGTESLLPEAAQLDYLWFINSNDPKGDAARIVAELKNMPDIQYSAIIAPDTLKNIGNLIL
jgi:hypothetical protein